MSKVYYPVIFHPEETGGFSAVVPDVDGCFSEGNTFSETVEMVQDAIGLAIEDMQDAPVASEPNSFELESGDFVTVVPFDAVKYRQKNDNRAVKKTLSLPSWLNSMAEEQQINFSAVLQSALKQRLGL